MGIVLLKEAGWAGVANEEPLKPSWGASPGAAGSIFGLMRAERLRAGWRISDFGTSHFCGEFMAHFLECASPYLFLSLMWLWSWRWPGLRRLRLPVSSVELRKALLCNFRKRVFQEVPCKTSFNSFGTLPLLLFPSFCFCCLVSAVAVSIRWVTGLSRLVWPRAASLVGGVMAGLGTIILWRLLTQNSVPVVACLASDVDSGRFLVIKPPRGSENLIFGPFCGAICRGNRKIGLGCSEFERNPTRGRAVSAA